MLRLGKILMADDEKNFLEAHADLLREEGYECDCAPDAEAAKTLLAKGEYDLLIADIKMPGNNELELIESLPAIREGLPVILVTGYPSLDTAVKSTRLSVVGYLMKPVNIEDFLKLVRESVIRSQTFRQFYRLRHRMHEVQNELGSLDGLKNLAPASPSFVDVDVFLHYTIKNILASVFDLRDLTQALTHHKPKEQVCQLLNCPRHVELTEAIRDGIYVLEKTKTSFKSKELALLRERLESALNVNMP